MLQKAMFNQTKRRRCSVDAIVVANYLAVMKLGVVTKSKGIVHVLQNNLWAESIVSTLTRLTQQTIRKKRYQISLGLEVSDCLLMRCLIEYRKWMTLCRDLDGNEFINPGVARLYSAQVSCHISNTFLCKQVGCNQMLFNHGAKHCQPVG